MTRSAVIIGGGHNGLVCASYLARAGLKVTVLERRSVVGGTAVTEEFHPGFRNSVASYTVSLLHPRIIEELHLAAHGLKIIERSVNNFIPLPDGNSLTAFVDEADFLEEVARFSVADAAALPRFYETLSPVTNVLRELMVVAPPALVDGGVADLFRLFSMSRRFSRLSTSERRTLLQLFTVSAGELLDDEFTCSALKALIGFDAIVGNYASPYQAGSAYVLVHHLLGEVNGKQGRWGHAIGGMGAISQAMAAEARMLGVNIETDVAVTAVNVHRNKAVSVTTSGGVKVTADIFISNLNPKLLYLDLLAPDQIAASTRRHFERYKCQSGSFRMNLALSSPPSFKADTPTGALTGGIILAPDLKYMDRAFQDAVEHGFSKQPVVEMLIPSLVDDSLAPPGMHVASLFCQQFNPDLGAAWSTHKTDAISSILATVDQYAPGFSDNIVGLQAFSPHDLETTFGLVGGDIFHGRLSLDQLFSARPMLGAGRYATEIDGLYMCGAGTHPGGGVSGLPGFNAAKEILRRL